MFHSCYRQVLHMRTSPTLCALLLLLRRSFLERIHGFKRGLHERAGWDWKLIGNLDAYWNSRLFLPVVIHDLPDNMVILNAYDNFPATNRAEWWKHQTSCRAMYCDTDSRNFHQDSLPCNLFSPEFPSKWTQVEAAADVGVEIAVKSVRRPDGYNSVLWIKWIALIYVMSNSQ